MQSPPISVVFERSKPETPRLELTPLIDVIFQLLIFFMISSSFLYPSLDIALPKLKNEEASKQSQKIIVSVDKDGTFFLNNVPVEKNNLQNSIQSHLLDAENKSVFFRADKETNYQEVLDVMHIANAAGTEHFNFIYEDAL